MSIESEGADNELNVERPLTKDDLQKLIQVDQYMSSEVCTCVLLPPYMYVYVMLQSCVMYVAVLLAPPLPPRLSSSLPLHAVNFHTRQQHMLTIILKNHHLVAMASSRTIAITTGDTEPPHSTSVTTHWRLVGVTRRQIMVRDCRHMYTMNSVGGNTYMTG